MKWINLDYKTKLQISFIFCMFCAGVILPSFTIYFYGISSIAWLAISYICIWMGTSLAISLTNIERYENDRNENQKD